MKPRWLATLVAALIPVLSSTGWGLPLSDLRQAVRLRLRDTTSDTSRQQFKDVDIDAVLNEAQRQVLNQTWLLAGTTTFGLTAGVREYPLPSDFSAIFRITLANKALVEVTQPGLDSSGNNQQGVGIDWTVASSTPTAYYVLRATNTTSSVIGFYPKPSTTTVNTCFIQYAQQVSALTSDADVPFNGQLELYSYHDMLVDYAVGTLWYTQGVPELGDPFLKLYTAKLGTLVSNLGKMPNYNPSLVGYRGVRQ